MLAIRAQRISLRAFALAAALLATVGAGVAVAGMSKTDAAARMFQLAHWKAACDQGYWKCESGFLQGPYGPAKGNPEWTGDVTIMRRHGKSPSIQTCVVLVGLNHDGSTHSLAIDCEYALTARDAAASWSAGDIDGAAHRSRRLAVWELSHAGGALAR